MRAPAAGLILLVLFLCGCDTRKSFPVRTEPPGAEVLLDGALVGVTPTTVLLDTKQEVHTITLRRPGFTPVEQRVVTKSLLEGPTENCAAVACSPCCFFVPLALTYERTFSPKALEITLERAGQGLEVVCRPIGAQIWVDGVLVAQTEAAREETLEGNARVSAPADYGIATVPLEPKVVKVEIRADGFTSREFQVQIRAEEYIHLRLDLVRKDAP